MATKPQALIEDEENRRKRLRHWIDNQYGGTASFFGREIGITQGEISSLLLGTRAFGEAKARTIEERSNMPLRYLDRREPGDDECYDDTDVIAIYGIPGLKLYSRIKQLLVCRDWLVDFVHSYTSINNLKIITAVGDSMAPKVKDGDPLIVDIGVNVLLEGRTGMYVAKVGEDVFIRYLDTLPYEGVVALAENKTFPIFTLAKSQEEIEVIGRVLNTWCKT